MTLEVFGGFDHLNLVLVIVFESETICAKENLVKDTTNSFNFLFNREENQFKTKKSNVSISPLSC